MSTLPELIKLADQSIANYTRAIESMTASLQSLKTLDEVMGERIETSEIRESLLSLLIATKLRRREARATRNELEAAMRAKVQESFERMDTWSSHQDYLESQASDHE